MDIEGDTYQLRHITFSAPDTYEIYLNSDVVFKAVARNVSFGRVRDFTDKAGNKLLELKHVRSLVPTNEIWQNGQSILKMTQPFQGQYRLEGEGTGGKYVVDVDEMLEKASGGSTKAIDSWKIIDGESVTRAVIRVADRFNSTYSIVVAAGAQTHVVLCLCVLLSETIGFGPALPSM